MAVGAQCGRGAEAATARSRVATMAEGTRASHRYVPSGIGPIFTIRSSMVNLGL
jgi:hypothetical protein